jgi:hypothetical protein
LYHFKWGLVHEMKELIDCEVFTCSTDAETILLLVLTVVWLLSLYKRRSIVSASVEHVKTSQSISSFISWTKPHLKWYK